MAKIIGEKYKVVFESADGTVIEMDATAVEFNMRQEIAPVPSWGNPTAMIRGVVSYDLRLVGNGNPLMSHHDFKKHREEMRTASEWKCSYCGRPNKRARETCQSCGAVRSFLYE